MAKSKGKKKKSYSRKKKYTKRKPGVGIIGKAGLGIAVGTPFFVSGIVGLDRAIAGKGFSFMSRIMYAFYAFINALVLGFGGDMPYKQVALTLKDGTTKQQVMRERVPEGAFVTSTIIGTTMFAGDLLAVKFLGKNIKAPGTNYNLI